MSNFLGNPIENNKFIKNYIKTQKIEISQDEIASEWFLGSPQALPDTLRAKSRGPLTFQHRAMLPPMDF